MAKEKLKELKSEHEIDHKFDKGVEAALATRIVDNEYGTAEGNNQLANDDYESYLNLLNCERSEKKYSWLSNISVPEFTSLHLMSQGLSATQNFSTRDFTEVYIGDKNSVPAARAEKKLINSTLNQRELFYYQKLMRANSAKDMDGVAYFRCWWEQKLKPGIVGTETQMEEADVDIFGNPMIDRAVQTPDVNFVEVPVEGEVVEFDRFNFDVIDRRDIFTSSEYTYSLQQKKWVIIRYTATISWLENHATEMGYFNLELLRNADIRGDTKGKGTHSDDYGIPKGDDSIMTPVKDWLIVERYGEDWVIVETDESGIESIEPGIDTNGNVLEGAELRNITSAFAISGSHKILVRFQLGKYMSATGMPYIPLIRGICYVHPSKDDGMGDGKCSKELQIALDDTINISNDRVMLSTLMTFIGRKGAIEDNDSIYMEPEHIIKVEDVNEDLKELKITDNIAGAMTQAGFMVSKMQQLQAVDPTASAPIPVQTATAEARAEARTNIRNQYKELTFENTFFTEFYWMISQMTWQFAREETLIKHLGELAQDYDPSLSYSYTPITEAIETEHGKRTKINAYLQQLQILANVPNPNTAKLINDIYVNINKLMGAEFEVLSDRLLDESVPITQSQGDVAGQQPLVPTSNEQGFDQSSSEQFARQAQGGIA